jgi:hypothetical protein
MSTPSDDGLPPGDDELVARYREASALENAAPRPGLRAAVLAQAGRQFLTPSLRAEAANDRRWLITTAASVAVLGIAGLLALQIDRGSQQEQDLALGRSTAPAATPAAQEAALAAARQPEFRQNADAHGAAAPEKPQRKPHGKTKLAEAFEPAPKPAPAPEIPPAAMRAPALDPDGIAAERAVAAPPPLTAVRARQDVAAAPPALAEALPAFTPAQRLLSAAAAGQTEAVREALQSGAPPDAADAAARTAVMLAAARGDDALVRLLLQAGADARRADRNGMTAADHARRAGHQALARQIDAVAKNQK